MGADAGSRASSLSAGGVSGTIFPQPVTVVVGEDSKFKEVVATMAGGIPSPNNFSDDVWLKLSAILRLVNGHHMGGQDSQTWHPLVYMPTSGKCPVLSGPVRTMSETCPVLLNVVRSCPGNMSGMSGNVRKGVRNVQSRLKG